MRVGHVQFRLSKRSVAKLSRDSEISSKASPVRGVRSGSLGLQLMFVVAAAVTADVCFSGSKRNHSRLLSSFVAQEPLAKSVVKGGLASLLVILGRGLRHVRVGAGPRRLSQVLIPAHVVV